MSGRYLDINRPSSSGKRSNVGTPNNVEIELSGPPSPVPSSFDSQSRIRSYASSQINLVNPPTHFDNNLDPHQGRSLRPRSSLNSLNSPLDYVLGLYGNPFEEPPDDRHPPTVEKNLSRSPNPRTAPARRKWSKVTIAFCLLAIALLVVAAILIPLYFFVLRPKDTTQNSVNTDLNSNSTAASGTTTSLSPTPTASLSTGPSVVPSTQNSSSPDIPPSANGTVLDSTKWLDTTDFNLTYTNATIGGLSIMGLNSTWDDSVQPNSNIPPLSQPFPYGSKPIKGISLGGWLVLEPFITPSLFDPYPLSLGIIDEWTLCQHLGPEQAAYNMEEHYLSFVTRSTFEEMRDAGFDHVRINFPYWIIENVNPDDPYVEKVGWRYLLRAIEWARENGLRINLVLHAAPGSQNGFNHSGREGIIGWLNGTASGAEYAQMTTEFWTQLATFFSQPRYINIITMVSILNEPDELVLNPSSVNTWTQQTYSAVREAGFNGSILISDGFLAPSAFIGIFPQKTYPGLIMDMHNYMIFTSGTLEQTHQEKVITACSSWSSLIEQSVDASEGFGGPTIVGEWSIADTDCALYVNGVGAGSRWEGTFPPGNDQLGCPNADDCSCTNANADASDYSDTYELFFADFFAAQASSWDVSWGGFYWTWDTENATQWSYKKLSAAGIVNLGSSNFSCSGSTPNFQSLGLSETY